MKRDTAKQVEHLINSKEGPLYTQGQEISFFDETTGEWGRGFVLGGDVQAGTDGEVRMQVQTPDSRVVALEFTKDQQDALPKPIEFTSGVTAFIDATYNSRGKEVSRHSFYIDNSEIQPDGSIRYTVREYDGNMADGNQIAKHDHVPQELLKAYYRVVELREKVRIAEKEILRKTKDHRSTLQQQKQAAEAKIQKIYDVLPDVGDMNKAAGTDIKSLRVQIDAFHQKAEDLLLDLETAIASAENEQQVATIERVQLTPKERAELLSYAKDIGKQIVSAERQFTEEADRKKKEFKEQAIDEDILVLKGEDKEIKKKWNKDLRALERKQTRLEQSRDSLIQKRDTQQVVVDDAKQEWIDARQNNRPTREIDRLEKYLRKEEAKLEQIEKKVEIEEQKIVQIEDAILAHNDEKPRFSSATIKKELLEKDYSSVVDKKAEQWKKEKFKEFFQDLLQKLRTTDTEAARHLVEQIDVSRMSELAVKTADLEDVTLHGQQLYDYRDKGPDSVYEQKNMEILGRLVDAAQREDMSEFSHYAETEGSFDFDTDMEQEAQKAVTLLAELEALPDVEQPRPLIRELKELSAITGRARKELSSLDVAKKLSAIDYGAVAHPDPSTLDKDGLNRLRKNTRDYLSARIEKLHIDWETIKTSRVDQETTAVDTNTSRETKDLMLAFGQHELMEVVKEQLPLIRETMREMYADGLTASVKAGFKNMFEKGKPQASLMNELRNAGIVDWDAFVELWQSELSDSVAETMHQAAEANMKKEVAKSLTSWDKFKNELGPTAWKTIKNFMLFGGTIGAVGFVASAAFPAVAGGLAFGMATAGVGGGIADRLKKMLPWKKKEQEQQEAAARFQNMLAKKRDAMVDTLIAQQFGAAGDSPDSLDRFDQLPMFASVLGQVLREKTTGSEDVHGVTLTGEARQMYIRALEQLNPKERNEATEKKLALLLAKMNDTGDTMQKLAEIHGKKDMRAHEIFGQQYAALDESSNNSDTYRAVSEMSRAAVWSAASYGAIGLARGAGLVGRLAAGGTLGAIMGARAGMTTRETIVREKRAEIAKEAFDLKIDDITYYMDRIRSGSASPEQMRVFGVTLQEMRRISKGEGTDTEVAVWDYFVDMDQNPPVETAYYKQVKALLADAQLLAFREGALLDDPAQKARLEGLAASLFEGGRDMRTVGEKEVDEQLQAEREKQAQRAGRVHVAKQAGIGAIRSILTGAAFIGASEAGGYAWSEAKELYNDMYNPAVSEGNPGYQEYLDQQQEYRDAAAAREEAAANEQASQEGARVEAEPTYNPNIDANGNELHSTYTIDQGGSVWGALDRFFADNQELFAEKGITDRDVFREWRSEQLNDLGYRYVDGHWGHPVIVHEGAQVELFETPSGKLEARIVDPTGDTVDARDTLYFRNSTPDTSAIEIVLNQDTPAPSETMTPGDAFRAQQGYLDTNSDGYVSSEEASIYSPENATLAEARADFNARVPLTGEESAWVSSLVDAARDAGYSSEALLGAIDSAGDADGSFESQELLDFVRSSDRSPEAFLGMLEALDGGNGRTFVASDIPANAPDSFSSTFAANNPEMAPGVEVVEAANTNVESPVGTGVETLTPAEFSDISQELNSAIDQLHSYDYDNADAQYLYTTFNNFITSALQNNPELLVAERDILTGELTLSIDKTLENLVQTQDRYDMDDFEVLFNRPSIENPVVANGGNTLSYLSGSETHILHTPDVQYDMVNGELRVWPTGDNPDTAQVVPTENIPALVSSLQDRGAVQAA